jgi:hypothetical protein
VTIFKKDDSAHVASYRRVSILNNISKVLRIISCPFILNMLCTYISMLFEFQIIILSRVSD